MSTTYKMVVPLNYSNFVQSAHYLEINKIYSQAMMQKLLAVEEQVKQEFYKASEKERRTKYCSNPNYVYESFGWETK